MSDNTTEKGIITHSQRNYPIFFLPILIILVILLLREIIGSIVSFLINNLVEFNDHEFFATILLNITLIIIMLSIMLFLIKFRYLKLNYQNSNKGLGLRTTTLTYLACFGLVYVITFFYAIISIDNPPVSSYEVITLTPENLSLLNVTFLFILLAVLAPIFEEFVFRRLFIPYLESGYGTIGAILISSITFGLIHTENDLLNGDLSFAVIHLINAFILGLGLGFVYVATRNIVYPVIFHGFNNFFPPFVSQLILAYFKIDVQGSLNQPEYNIVALLGLILLVEMVIGIIILGFALFSRISRQKVIFLINQIPNSLNKSRKGIISIGICIVSIFMFFTVFWPVFISNYLADTIFNMNAADSVIFLFITDLMILTLFIMLILYFRTSLPNVTSKTNPIIRFENKSLNEIQDGLINNQYRNEVRKFCVHCGANLINEAKFCIKCGKEV